MLCFPLLFALISFVSSQRASMGSDGVSNLLLRAGPSKSVIAKAPLSVEGPVTASGRMAVAGCNTGVFNCISNSAFPSPLSGFITASNDLYVEGDVEAQRVVSRSFFNAGGCLSANFNCIALSTPVPGIIPASISAADDLFVGGDLRAGIATFATSATVPTIVTNSISSSGATVSVNDALSVVGSITATSIAVTSVAPTSISTPGGLSVTLGGTFGSITTSGTITATQGITVLSVAATNFLRTGGPLRAGGACNNTLYHCMSNIALPASSSLLNHISNEDDLFVADGGYFGGRLVANVLTAQTLIEVGTWDLQEETIDATIASVTLSYSFTLTFRNIVIQTAMTNGGSVFCKGALIDGVVMSKRADTASVLQRVSQLTFAMKEHEGEAHRTETAKRTEGPLPMRLALPANEWKRAFPEAVVDLEGQSLVLESYPGMIAMAGVKELTTLVEDLRTKNEQLTQAVEQLQSQVRQLLEASTKK